MKTKVKALDSFVHGRTHLHAGDEAEFSKGEAEELVKSGLVQLIGEGEAASAQKQDTPTDDDLVGGVPQEKMDDEPANKMDADPDNKGASRKTSTKK